MTRSPDIRHELWLANRLQDPTLFSGTTTAEIRAERVRQRIIELDWGNRRAGYHGEDPESFAELFERIYGAPLFPTTDEKEQPCES